MEPAAVPSILEYARPAPGTGPSALPTTYYPGPAAPQARGKSRGTGAAVLLAALILLVVLLACFCGRGACRRCRFEPAGPASLAKKLAARGWTVYYRRGCPYCDKQAALLGGFSREVSFGPDGALLRSYTAKPALAFDAIRGFPYWHNPLTGESRLGFQDAAALAKM